jgi:hypothetical protein
MPIKIFQQLLVLIGAAVGALIQVEASKRCWKLYQSGRGLAQFS